MSNAVLPPIVIDRRTKHGACTRWQIQTWRTFRARLASWRAR